MPHFTAPFFAHVTNAVQYGNGVKAQAVYLSQYQRAQDQLGLSIPAGSVFAFNQQVYAALGRFE